MDDIVKDSSVLKQAIKNRMDELGITGHQIALDATKRGIKGVTDRSISVYFNNSHAKGALNQYQLLFIAYRLGIRVRLNIGEPVMEGGKLRHVVPQPYDEAKALAELEQVFPFVQEVAKLAEKVIPKKRKKKNG